MSRTRLIIDGKAVPLPPGTDIAITYQAHDIRNIGSRDGAYAETFELPDTNEVRAALGHSNLVNSATETPYTLIPATIEQDYNTVITGKVGHTEVGEGFSIEFNGQNADLFDHIKGKKLTDLDLSDLDHQFSNANVLAANTHDPTRGYVYPLINYGYWTNRYFDPTNQHFSELYPAVYVSTLLERMAAPYTLTGSLLTDPRFVRMVVPFTNEKFVYREGYVEQFDGKGLVTAPQYYSNAARNIIFNTYTSATPGQWNGANEYLVSVIGRYKVKLTIDYSMSQSGIGVGFNEIKLMSRNLASVTRMVNYIPIIDEGHRVITVDFETNILTFGEVLYLRWEPGSYDTNNVYLYNGTSMEVELIDQFLAYGETHLDVNLPDISQEDLLLTVCNMFNVVIQTDTPKKVIRLDLLRDLKIKPTLDWSSKIDWSTKPKHVFALDDYAQSNVIGYEPIEDGYGADVPLQDLTTISVANERLELEKETYISPFTSTYLQPAFKNSLSVPFIPSVTVKVNNLGLWRNSLEYSPADYVLYGGDYWHPLTTIPIGVAPGFGSSYWEWVPVDTVLEYNGATPRLLVLETRPGGSTIPVGENIMGGTYSNLNTQAVFEKSNGAGINAEAMRTGFHWITELMLQKTRMLTLKMRLNLSDVNQLDFMRPITLNVPIKGLEGAFYLNKVSQFNPMNAASTEVELVRLYGFPVITDGTSDITASHLEYSDEYSLEYN